MVGVGARRRVAMGVGYATQGSVIKGHSHFRQGLAKIVESIRYVSYLLSIARRAAAGTYRRSRPAASPLNPRHIMATRTPIIRSGAAIMFRLSSDVSRATRAVTNLPRGALRWL